MKTLSSDLMKKMHVFDLHWHKNKSTALIVQKLWFRILNEWHVLPTIIGLVVVDKHAGDIQAFRFFPKQNNLIFCVDGKIHQHLDVKKFLR